MTLYAVTLLARPTHRLHPRRHAIGVAPGDFVIADPASLPPEIDEWFPFLSANELGAFGAVAVFRYRPAPMKLEQEPWPG